MNIADAKRVLILGIGGSGMRGLSVLLNAKGKEIIGTDRNMETIWGDKSLGEMDLKLEDGINIKRDKIDIVIHTDAIGDDNNLVKEAKDKGISCWPYHQALGKMANDYDVVAVAGTHGKSSTTSMLAHICIEAGLDPTVLVGARALDLGNTNARSGQGKYFILEADEYRNHYHVFRPQLALVTSIDFDHPDFFAARRDVEKSFSVFLSQVEKAGTIFAARELIEQEKNVTWPASVVAVNHVEAPIELSVPGKHMWDNARLALAAAIKLGVSPKIARQALANWRGLGRRFELLGELGGLKIISDYGHHPQEIRATLLAARERYNKARILAVLEPHMKERLEAFGNDFVSALMLADAVALVPTYQPVGRDAGEGASRQEDILETRLEGLGRMVFRLKKVEDVGGMLAKYGSMFDVAIGLSAGDLDAALRKLVNAS